IQSSIEGSCLSGAGRSCYQENAIRTLNDRLEARVILLAETKVTDVHGDGATVQNTHDRGLAVYSRQAADAEVEMLALDGHLDSAVLGSPFLGDVDLTHDLDTRDHRRQQTARRAVE